MIIPSFAKGEARKTFSHILCVFFAFIVLTVALFYCPKKVWANEERHDKYLSILPLTGMLSAVFARVPQIITNFKQQHTGQVGINS